MRSELPTLHAGFRDAVHDSQAVFRTVMRAMSVPALPVGLPTNLAPPAPLIATAAAILPAFSLSARYDVSTSRCIAVQRPDM